MQKFWPAATAGFAASGLLWRGRVQGLAVLGEPPPAGVDDLDGSGYRLVTAAGVTVDRATARAAVAHARAEGLDVVDLVPGDLPGARVIELVRMVDPVTYRSDAMAGGHTAGQAILATGDVLTRARVTEAEGLAAPDMVRLATTLKRHAPWTTDVVVAPRMSWVPDAPADRWGRLEAAFMGATGHVVTAKAFGLGALAAGVARRRPGPLAALVAYHLQPLIATSGTALRPRDRTRTTVARTVVAGADVAATLAQMPGAVLSPDAEVAESRAAQRPVLDAGPEALLEPRRHDCPICGSTDLSPWLETDDDLQGKPGRFHLDRCGSCGTAFQNPRLTLAGLDFYYRDFYDGLGQEGFELTFRAETDSYDGRVAAVGSVTTPRRWLDVGTGQGHQCLVTRERWPDAVIHGLDMTDAIDEADRRGWVDKAYRGLFPELAPDLAGQYDVVSMHHYLEHVRDPAAELDAAATVLEPGGHLEIEVPNPESAVGRRLGRWWVANFQPQHQHLIPYGQLESMLRARGFTPVLVQFAEAHQPYDLLFAVYLGLNHLLPLGDVPWRDAPPSAATRLRRSALFAASGPVAAVAAGIDQAIKPVVKRWSSNTYRVVARYDGVPVAAVPPAPTAG